ncbi:hypothetical protein QQZ08_011125 [Neonectria magnoliae]|uniref:F-box domain-containing protein n=1 Tax=Neonectria magnoliae TaxID=2732573 RepID=A0ABR1HD82_9HYPO
MNATNTTGLASLPSEIIDEICSTLPTRPLRCLRLVNHRLGDIATAWAFRHVRLAARQGCYDHQHFVWIAQSEKLRPLVREVTCDSWRGPGVGYWASWDHYISGHPSDFLNALPLIRCFPNMTSLHLCFGGYAKHDYSSSTIDNGGIETDGFRYRVLDTVFRCLNGTWSAKTQQKMDEEWLSYDFEADYEMMPPEAAGLGPMPLRELTISNLADYYDKRVGNAEMFTKQLSASRLRGRKIYITPHEIERPSSGTRPEKTMRLRENYEMLDGLLMILSMCSRDAFGWNPRMNFQAVRSGESFDPRIPPLKFMMVGK